MKQYRIGLCWILGSKGNVLHANVNVGFFHIYAQLTRYYALVRTSPPKYYILTQRPSPRIGQDSASMLQCVKCTRSTLYSDSMYGRLVIKDKFKRGFSFVFTWASHFILSRRADE